MRPTAEWRQFHIFYRGVAETNLGEIGGAHELLHTGSVKAAHQITAHNAGWPSRFRFAGSVLCSGGCELYRSLRHFTSRSTMKNPHHRVSCLTVFLLAGSALQVQGKAPDSIYFNGPIHTMIRDGDRVEAVAVSDGEISAVGTKDALIATKDSDTKLVDLGGKCLMPGFIDPYSHVIQQSLKFSVVNLDPDPIGDVRTIADIQRKLSERIKEQKLEAGRWVFGWGYDDTGVEEHRHPTRDDLDAVSTEHPIILMHISSHLMTSNSKALDVAGITAETPDRRGRQDSATRG